MRCTLSEDDNIAFQVSIHAELVTRVISHVVLLSMPRDVRYQSLYPGPTSSPIQDLRCGRAAAGPSLRASPLGNYRRGVQPYSTACGNEHVDGVALWARFLARGRMRGVSSALNVVYPAVCSQKRLPSLRDNFFP